MSRSDDDAMEDIAAAIISTKPAVKWRDIAGTRDFLAHHYFATSPEVVQAVLDKDLPSLEQAVAQMPEA